MSEPPRIDPALEFGGQQPERSDQDFKQRLQGLQDSFYAHNAFYGPYPPQAQAASQTPADAALQAIATAAQDRRPSTPSSASVGAADPNSQSAQTKLGPDGKRLRACDHCRSLKVRCDPQEENGVISEAIPCKRCLKSKKVCVTTAPTKKRTKKADTRVAELEKKVNELTARLGDNAVASYAYDTHPPLPDGAQSIEYADSTRPEKRRRMNDQHDALVSSFSRPRQGHFDSWPYVCYYLGTNIAMVLRRPMLLRWNQYMDECISELESSDALPSDKVLCYHIKLAAIAENVASQFSMDDPAPSANFSEKYNEIALRNYDTKLELLRPQRPPNADQTVLKFSESVVSLYTHEVAMHHTQNIDDALEEGRRKSLGAVQTSSLKECVKSCHGILDSFLSLEFDAFYALPLMFSVRCVYSTVCLTKLWADATFPGDLGSVITPDSLRLEHYFDNLIRRFQNTEERDPQSPHTKFPRILLRLREKFNRMKNGESCVDVFSGQPGPASASGTSVPTATNPAANGAHEQTRHTFPANGNNVATTQTPLHLLSEVAQQAQAPPLQQGYYDNGMGGQGVNTYNWDMAAFGDFDFSSMGMGVDLASLFGGDMGGYEPQPAPPQYGPHQAAPAPVYPESSSWNA
ncbi:hypothetical protein BK809_0003646 [Diplodia seriata]|uniref:Zn(2)-C6 fungal-type domain-containing protein n=1 Tax=Diplodia seriata TaxID=420778 RepID=A0A1S8BGA6_9PEZI|nr:hypothetical protein BK809_0003646 [Diplodia seriata]